MDPERLAETQRRVRVQEAAVQPPAGHPRLRTRRSMQSGWPRSAAAQSLFSFLWTERRSNVPDRLLHEKPALRRASPLCDGWTSSIADPPSAEATRFFYRTGNTSSGFWFYLASPILTAGTRSEAVLREENLRVASTTETE